MGYRFTKITSIAGILAVCGVWITFGNTVPGVDSLPVQSHQTAGAVKTELKTAEEFAETATLGLDGVERFTFDRMESRNLVTQNEDSTVSMLTHEEIVADFPNFNQNKGVVRCLPNFFDGRSIKPTDISLTQNGEPYPYFINGSNNMTCINFGTDDYVQGQQEYELSYKTENVIYSPSKQEYDEFYWNIFPTDRPQAIRSASFILSFDEALSKAIIKDQNACYIGRHGSTQRCEAEMFAQGDGTVDYVLQPVTLGKHSGMTFAVGIERGVVTLGKQTRAMQGLYLSGIGIFTLVFLGTILLERRDKKATTYRGYSVAQYEPRDDISLIDASVLIECDDPETTAAFLMQGIMNGDYDYFQDQAGNYMIRLNRPITEGHMSVQDEFTNALFGSYAARSHQYVMPNLIMPATSDIDTGKSLWQFLKACEQRTMKKFHKSTFVPLATLCGVAACVLSVMMLPKMALVDENIFFGLGILLFIGYSFTSGGLPIIIESLGQKRPTVVGAEAREYVLGLREFIRVAETDRINFLQSVPGAEQYVINGEKRYKLYEKLLPWAILFGYEKTWVRQMKTLLTQHPDIPVQHRSFYDMSNMPRFAGNCVESYSSSVSAGSSSGGSSGGGSVGGGGGGGSMGGR